MNVFWVCLLVFAVAAVTAWVCYVRGYADGWWDQGHGLPSKLKRRRR
jgi:hypothetical protein